MRQTKNKNTDCVKKPDQCGYEDCRGGTIQYHDWYERKEGAIPYGAEDVSGPLPIRRFMCCDCGRTFSVRPWFLAFGHRFTAAAYEAFLLGQSRSGDWWRPGAQATQAVRDRLRRAAQALTERLEQYLGRPPSVRTDTGHVLDLAQTIASQQSTPQEPRYACHVLFLAIAKTRARARYSLTAS